MIWNSERSLTYHRCVNLPHINLQLHIAVESDDPDKDSEYFVSKGGQVHRKMSCYPFRRRTDRFDRPVGKLHSACEKEQGN